MELLCPLCAQTNNPITWHNGIMKEAIWQTEEEIHSATGLCNKQNYCIVSQISTPRAQWPIEVPIKDISLHLEVFEYLHLLTF